MRKSDIHGQIARILRGKVDRPNQLARKILDTIEAAGMEPPKVEVVYDKGCEARSFNIRMNKWEDENE